MASFNLVNYSLRPNKGIQRSLVFEGVRILQTQLDLENLLYVGFGSIWFTDFMMAHKLLQVRDMISIEATEIGFQRAKFNQPYKTVVVKEGLSYDVLPNLFKASELSVRPWLVWLDYDKGLDESKTDDLRLVIENAPPNSILITTFPCTGLGKPGNRPERIQKLLGSIVPDDLSKESCADEKLPETLLTLTSDFMVSVASSASRPGGFIPAFRLSYQDGTPMITIGGVLPTKGAVAAAKSAILSKDWPGISLDPIVTPPLTLKEAAMLQAQLPSSHPLTRRAVQALGFDLEDQQIRSFERYYQYYPIFAQIST
jgi:hypothetical protein